MLISERVFEIIKERGMSQKAFSERTGIPQSTISDWKGKHVNPSADKIMIICDVLEISPYELLSGTESKNYQMPDYIMVNKDSDEYELVEIYRNMTKKQQSRLLGYAEAIMEKK